MAALAIMVPVALVGLILWLVVGVRQRHLHPGLASATSFYAHLMQIAAATAALLGGAVLVRALLGLIDMSFSYSNGIGFAAGGGSCTSVSGGPAVCTPSVSPTVDVTPQRTQDLVLAATLVVVGVGFVIIHRRLAGLAQRSLGGPPAWVSFGTQVAFVALYGFAALFGLIAAVYGVLSYVILPAGQSVQANIPPTLGGRQPFGDMLGAALVFVPAWVVAVVLLRRRLRTSAPEPPQAHTDAGVPAPA